MSHGTFIAGIGRDKAFVAYGESILLSKIQHEDLPAYEGADRDAYEEHLERFLAGNRIVPEAFEYLVISPEGSSLPWDTTPLSPTLFQQPIDSPELEQCTRWFVTDASATKDWQLTGKAYSGFVLKVDSAEAGPLVFSS
jgi:hypothetical protein